MNLIDVGGSGLQASEIVLGVMRMGGLEDRRAQELVETADACGINFYDNADIYGGGRSEEIFGRAVRAVPGLRERILVQSKCGIRPNEYDFTKEHILQAVDGSLQRLGTDYLDVLLLHRPDPLMEPDEVAEAFLTLHNTGKVRHFGVSNQNFMQMELLQRALPVKLIADQLQFGLKASGMIDAGLHVNMTDDASVMRDGGTIEYCRLKNITIQAWSPFQHGFFAGPFIGNPDFPELNAALGRIAEKYSVSADAVAAAWILRHPARMQVIAGTTRPDRLRRICAASGFRLTHAEWFELYRAAGHQLP